MEEQTKENTAPNQSIFDNLIIRTMKQDLGMAPGKIKISEFKPLKAGREEKQKTAKQLLAQAKKAFKEQDYEKANQLSQGIIQDKGVSWFTRFRAKGVINKLGGLQQKLAKEEQKKEKRQEKLAKEATPPATIAIPANIQPPPSLPKVPTPPSPSQMPKPAIPEPEIKEPPPAPDFIPAPTPPTPPAYQAPSIPPPPPFFEEAPEPKPQETTAVPYDFQKTQAPYPSLYDASAKIERSKPKAKLMSKLRLAFAYSVVILIVALGYFFWQNYLKTTPEPEPSPPSPVFSMENTETIEVPSGDLSVIKSSLRNIAKKNQTIGSFSHVIVKEAGEKTSFPDLLSVANALGIDSSLLITCETTSNCVKSDLFSNINADRYSFFIYYQMDLPADSQNPARLGLAIKLRDKPGIIAEKIMSDSEPNLAKAFKPIFIGEEPATIDSPFKTNTYSNATIRYVNFPERYLSLDYAIKNNILIIATSKESAFAALDRILSQ